MGVGGRGEVGWPASHEVIFILSNCQDKQQLCGVAVPGAVEDVLMTRLPLSPDPVSPTNELMRPPSCSWMESLFDFSLSVKNSLPRKSLTRIRLGGCDRVTRSQTKLVCEDLAADPVQGNVCVGFRDGNT